MQISKTNQVKHETLNVLIYGPPGSGKTRFSGTCHRKFKPLILSAESGLLSLRALGDFDFVAIEKFEQIQEAYEFLRSKPDHGYNTVILDSITEIQQVCMDKILRDEKREKAMIQDWGTLNTRMVNMIRAFRDMQMNLIVTALSDTVQDEETGSIKYVPLVQGKLKETLAGYFDEVFYLYTKEVKDEAGKPIIKRALQTQGSQKVLAKDRSGKLPMWVEPDFCKLFDLIFDREEKAKPVQETRKTNQEKKAHAEVAVQ